MSTIVNLAEVLINHVLKKHGLPIVLQQGSLLFSAQSFVPTSYPYIVIIPAGIEPSGNSNFDEPHDKRIFTFRFTVEICDDAGRNSDGNESIAGGWEVEEKIRTALTTFQQNNKPSLAHVEPIIANISGVQFEGSTLIVTQDLQQRRVVLIHSNYAVNSVQ